MLEVSFLSQVLSAQSFVGVQLAFLSIKKNTHGQAGLMLYRAAYLGARLNVLEGPGRRSAQSKEWGRSFCGGGSGRTSRHTHVVLKRWRYQERCRYEFYLYLMFNAIHADNDRTVNHDQICAPRMFRDRTVPHSKALAGSLRSVLRAFHVIDMPGYSQSSDGPVCRISTLNIEKASARSVLQCYVGRSDLSIL